MSRAQVPVGKGGGRSEGRPDGQSANTRQRLLDAAEQLARRSGPGNLSLDAVAAEAGVSKGGLLYHFPSKAKLLEGLVDSYLARFDDALCAAEPSGTPNLVLDAYLSQFLRERSSCEPASAGLLAALAENPDLLAPVAPRERAFLDRIRANASDPEFATVAFLTVHGLRAMSSLGIAVLNDTEAAEVIDWLRSRLNSIEARD